MASFIDRLKERKLVQWALAYVAGAWVVFEVSDAVGGRWQLPDVLYQGLSVVLVAGFFITLILAWYHGEKGRQRVGGVELLGIGAVLALAGLGLSFLPEPGSEDSLGAERAEDSALDAIPAPREGITRVALILADFENHTSDPHLADMTTSALRTDLAGSQRLALLDRGALQGALRRMEADPSAQVTREVAVEVAQREGVPFVVAGRVDAVGGSTQFLAELIRPGEDVSAAGRRVVAADSTEILAAIGELAMGLREDAGESASSIAESDPLPEITTRSLEALRLYARALRLGDDGGEYRRAAELLERAVTLDTAFAMGYRKLGAYLYNARIDRTRRIRSYKMAYLLRDRLTEPERLLAEIGYHDTVTGDTGAMLEAARTMLELYPDHATGLANLGWAYEALGLHAQAAETYRRRAQVSPDFLSLWSLANNLIALGHFDRADQTLSRLAEQSPGSWTVPWGRADLENAKGNYEAAESQLEALEAPARTNPSVRWRLLESRLGLSRRRGQGSQALGQAEELYKIRVSEGRAGEAVRQATRMANLHSRLLGDQAAAGAVLDEALNEHPQETIAPYDFPYLDLVEAYAWAGQPELSRALLSEYEEHVPSAERGHPDGKPGVLQRIVSQVALAEGDTDEAVSLLREAHDLLCHPARCAVLMAMAQDLAGRPDSAMAWYERYLERPRRARMDDEYLAPTLERLAQLHDEYGDPARAEEFYARFVDQWGEADAELQPRVDAARARLGR